MGTLMSDIMKKYIACLPQKNNALLLYSLFTLRPPIHNFLSPLPPHQPFCSPHQPNSYCLPILVSSPSMLWQQYALPCSSFQLQLHCHCCEVTQRGGVSMHHIKTMLPSPRNILWHDGIFCNPLVLQANSTFVHREFFKIVNGLLCILVASCVNLFAFIWIIFFFLIFSNLISFSLTWHALSQAMNSKLSRAKTPFFPNTPAETCFVSFMFFQMLFPSSSLFLATCFAALFLPSPSQSDLTLTLQLL